VDDNKLTINIKIMGKKCSNCSHGPYDSLSAYCDECMDDSNTGFGGFYDHRAGKSFSSYEEQREYYRTHNVSDGWEDDDDEL